MAVPQGRAAACQRFQPLGSNNGYLCCEHLGFSHVRAGNRARKDQPFRCYRCSTTKVDNKVHVSLPSTPPPAVSPIRRGRAGPWASPAQTCLGWGFAGGENTHCPHKVKRAFWSRSMLHAAGLLAIRVRKETGRENCWWDTRAPGTGLGWDDHSPEDVAQLLL